MPVINSIAAMADDLTEWRRDFHAHPELRYEEVRTAGIVAEKLRSWGIEVHEGIAKTGVVGVLHGRTGGGGRAVGLRADMDALPMQEQNDHPWRSTTDGKMHACGHDGHTTMLLGAARYLAETRNFDGTVHFIFQPAEEGGAGADRMIQEGLFERFPCDEVYGIHNAPLIPTRQCGIIAGPAMAAADTFTVTIEGYGGHAARPHLSIDPVVIGAQLILAWQGIVSRTVDPLGSAVLSCTQMHAGTTDNVIPGSAMLNGTVRTLDAAVRDHMEREITRVAENVCRAYGTRCQVAYERGYPVTFNHAAQADKFAAAAEAVLGPDTARRDMAPIMGAEDFSYMLQQRPGAFLWLGQGRGDGDAPVHNPRYDFNDEILPLGASLFATLVESELTAA